MEEVVGRDGLLGHDLLAPVAGRAGLEPGAPSCSSRTRTSYATTATAQRRGHLYAHCTAGRRHHPLPLRTSWSSEASRPSPCGSWSARPQSPGRRSWMSNKVSMAEHSSAISPVWDWSQDIESLPDLRMCSHLCQPDQAAQPKALGVRPVRAFEACGPNLHTEG